MKILTAVFLLMPGAIAFAQQKGHIHDYSAPNLGEWVVPGSAGVSCSLAEYQGAKALMIKKSFNDAKFAAVAYPRDVIFKDGEIELDMASTSGNDFIGLAFRIKDAHHYETLYFRPASSGTINAIQYMPAKQDDFDWWDYEADKYQAKATLPAKTWFHIKAVVKGRHLSVYIDYQLQPSMVYNDLDPGFKSGFAGVWFGNSAACVYKNLTITTY
jgi:hypothetical protein